MRNRRVQLVLFILIGLTAIFVGDHPLSGRVGEGFASPKRVVATPIGAATVRKGSDLPSDTDATVSPVDSSNVRPEPGPIINRQSSLSNSLAHLRRCLRSRIQNLKSEMPTVGYLSASRPTAARLTRRSSSWRVGRDTRSS